VKTLQLLQKSDVNYSAMIKKITLRNLKPSRSSL